MRKPYSHVVDLWSLGVIIYILLSGFHPFDPQGDANEDRLQENIRNLRYDFSDPVFDRISGYAKHLIQSLLQLDPQKRLDSNGVLMHPWLQSHSRLWNRPTSPRGAMVPPSFEMPRDVGASAMQRSSLTGVFGSFSGSRSQGVAAALASRGPAAPRMEIVENLASGSPATARRVSGAGRTNTRAGGGAEEALAALARRLQHRNASIEQTARSNEGYAVTTPTDHQAVAGLSEGARTASFHGLPQLASPLRGSTSPDIGGARTPTPRSASGEVPRLQGDSGGGSGAAHDSGGRTGRSGGSDERGEGTRGVRLPSGGAGDVLTESSPAPRPYDARGGGGTLTPRRSGSASQGLGGREPSPTSSTPHGSSSRVTPRLDVPSRFWGPGGSSADDDGVAAADGAAPRPFLNSGGAGEAIMLAGGRVLSASRSPLAEEGRRRRSLQDRHNSTTAAAAAAAAVSASMADRMHVPMRGDASGGGWPPPQGSPQAMAPWPQQQQPPLPPQQQQAFAAARPRSAMQFVPAALPPLSPPDMLSAAARPRSAMLYATQPQQQQQSLAGSPAPVASSRSPPTGYATMRPQQRVPTQPQVTGGPPGPPAVLDRRRRVSGGSVTTGGASSFVGTSMIGRQAPSMAMSPTGRSAAAAAAASQSRATAAALAATMFSKQRQRNGTSLAAAAAMMRPAPGLPAQPTVFRGAAAADPAPPRPATTPRGQTAVGQQQQQQQQLLTTTPRSVVAGQFSFPATTPRSSSGQLLPMTPLSSGSTVGQQQLAATTPRAGSVASATMHTASGSHTARQYDTLGSGSIGSYTWRGPGDDQGGRSGGRGGDLSYGGAGAPPLSARDRPRSGREYPDQQPRAGPARSELRGTRAGEHGASSTLIVGGVHAQRPGPQAR